jgi:hypothetical protein
MHLGEGKQEGECGFGSLILIHPVVMQAVEAAAC